MRSSGIGGQAVIEGVMMKNKDKYAVAVRKPDGTIEIDKQKFNGIGSSSIGKIPIIRGVFAFIDSLRLGMKTLTYSASFYEEEEEKESEHKNADTEKKESIVNAVIITVSILAAVGIFVLLPFFIANLLQSHIESTAYRGLIEGCIRIVLFVGYVKAISMMKDIKRVFMYHGAEHKTINCVEHGLPLTVENVRKQTKRHRRCGTSFLLLVMVISILFFLFITTSNLGLRMLFRILLIPVVAGVAYEFIRLAGSSDNVIVRILSQPGLWLQALTTKEPDDDMIEVAIASVDLVFDWKAYQLKVEEEELDARKEKARKEAVKASKAAVAAAMKAKKAAKIANEAKRKAGMDIEDDFEILEVEDDEELVEAEPVANETAATKQEQIVSEPEKSNADEEDEDDEIMSALDRFFDQ